MPRYPAFAVSLKQAPSDHSARPLTCCELQRMLVDFWSRNNIAALMVTLMAAHNKMKKHLKQLSAGALVLAAISQVHAQYTPPPPPVSFPGFLNEYWRAKDPAANKWDLGGEARVRFEAREGLGIAGQPDSVDFRDHGADVNNEYLLTRLRFHGGYNDKWWGFYSEGQSSLAFSDQRFAYVNANKVPGTMTKEGFGPESDTIDLHQGYFAFGNLAEFPVSLKIGRQELSYGDERLVGAFNWNNIGRAFDAAKLRFQNSWVGVDFFSGLPVVPRDGQFDLPSGDEVLSGVYATTTNCPMNILDGYFLARNVSRDAISAFRSPQFPQPTARDIYTVGGRLKSKPGELGNFDYTVEGAYQFGDYAAKADTDRLTQDAFMATVAAGYTFADLWAKPRLGAEFDYGSGDSNSKDGTHGTFDNLLPTNHKFYGSMDVISLQNIEDLGVSLTLKPTPRLSVALMGNLFWLANTHDAFYTVAGAPRTTGGYGVNSRYSSFVGSELTVVAGYAVTKFAQVEAGYGHFFTGDYVDQSLVKSGGSTDADWLYLQATLKF